ncbi:AAA family ATPase [Lactiplantibacillus plantarum]|uniref:AAA family ATPase n=1 Tax=Lactiplantibacillus plantarum TaxID=1590 RepID=UPI001BA4ED78|nr:AAA family ATPase [Lactiplantibacillus plantarum]MBS0936352.1 ATP-dependent Clp protease ATP-binding subunit [Lactiplantibacillus plantarum]MBS0943781.1 ATP-dependent Clp protease ATP-binding subunit [Lactiplantibacillus plantarum]
MSSPGTVTGAERPKITLHIPEDIQEKYNYALEELPEGPNTLIGYEDQLNRLEVQINNIDLKSVMLTGKAGVGKTATVEQLVYNMNHRPNYQLLVVSLALEELGEFDDHIFIGRMRSLLTDMRKIRKATEEFNHVNHVNMAIFIDEIHKLRFYGTTADSSAAMNALKDKLARSEFPIITATTDKEYLHYLSKDEAFGRRFHKISFEEPNRETTLKILERRLTYWHEHEGREIPKISNGFFDELLDVTNSYIRNEGNPAKSIKVLSSAVSYCEWYTGKYGKKHALDHEALAFVLEGEGYNIDITNRISAIKAELERQVLGQPLALHTIISILNAAVYLPRERKKPLMTLFLAGTTGTGKTQSAKALATALYGDERAMVVLNGGDYSTPEDALKAQHFIGNSVQVNKQVIILLDEIEKAHRNVHDGLMRVIDEGVVQDENGNEYSIANTVVIATSNLGADIFNDLSLTMNLNQIDHPEILTEGMLNAWYTKAASVKRALQNGDPDLNNGIKPEFLERFTMLVPFLPLARKNSADIAQMNLVKLQKSLFKAHIKLQLPPRLTNQEWQSLLINSKYDGVNQVAVMIAENVLNSESKMEGARAIIRFIDTTIKPAVADALAYRTDHQLSLDNGVFTLSTNGHATWENSEGLRPGVIVDYREKE